MNILDDVISGEPEEIPKNAKSYILVRKEIIRHFQKKYSEVALSDRTHICQLRGIRRGATSLTVENQHTILPEICLVLSELVDEGYLRINHHWLRRERVYYSLVKPIPNNYQ